VLPGNDGPIVPLEDLRFMKNEKHTPVVAKPRGDPVGEVKRGRAGGLKGGKARAKRLTPEQLRQIASAGARARWHRFDGRDWDK